MQGAAPFTYQGFDVLSWLPDGIESRSGAWTTPLERIDVPSGAFALAAPALHPVHTTKAVYRCLSRADHAPLWTWLSAQLGRYGSFWCPTFQRDLEITNSGTLGTWIIRYAGFAALFAADPSAKYLYGFTNGGALVATVKVTAAADNGDGTETITYSTNSLLVSGNGGIGVYVTTLVSVVAASLLRFARLDTDAISQTFATREIIDVAIEIATITGEAP